MKSEIAPLDQAFIVDPYTPVEGTETAEIVAMRKTHDAVYERLRHEVIAGKYNLEAFSDWVAEQRAAADYLEERVRYDRKLDFEPEEASTAVTVFSLARRRLDTQYALDRSVLRFTKGELDRAKRRIGKKIKREVRNGKGLDYFTSISKLEANYGNQLYEAERTEIDLTIPGVHQPQGMRGRLELESQARSVVANHLTTMHAKLLPQRQRSLNSR